MGDKVEKGQVIADGAATRNGELALGRNVLAAFMAWDGFNFEDAIIISEELVEADTYTSLHIEEFDIEIRETKLGREEFTRDIPNVSERQLRNLDENGIVRTGTYVRPGDVLVGKVSPKSKTELTPEEKLLHAIFGRAGEDVKNDSLEVPSGVEGIVIGTQKFSRRMSLSEDERKAFEAALKEAEAKGNERIAVAFGELVKEIEDVLKKKLTDEDNNPLVEGQEHRYVAEQAHQFDIEKLDIRSPQRKADVEKVHKNLWPAVETAIDAKERTLNSMKRGDELRSGVLQMVKVYVAAKRVISVGDKMAGRHGNKGVIAKILPQEDMPFLADGTPVQILLEPAGRAQPYERRPDSRDPLGLGRGRAGLPGHYAHLRRRHRAGHPQGPRTGRPAEPRQGPTLRRAHRRGVRAAFHRGLHLHDEAAPPGRRQGPRPLDRPLFADHPAAAGRQGPLRRPAIRRNGSLGPGSLRRGLHPPGTATVKSDDVEGRTKIYESMVKGENTLEAGTPASFDVLTNEIRGMALNMV